MSGTWVCVVTLLWHAVMWVIQFGFDFDFSINQLGGAAEKLQSWQISCSFSIKVSIGMSVLELTAAENPFNRDYPSRARETHTGKISSHASNQMSGLGGRSPAGTPSRAVLMMLRLMFVHHKREKSQPPRGETVSTAKPTRRKTGNPISHKSNAFCAKNRNFNYLLPNHLGLTNWLAGWIFKCISFERQIWQLLLSGCPTVSVSLYLWSARRGWASPAFIGGEIFVTSLVHFGDSWRNGGNSRLESQ